MILNKKQQTFNEIQMRPIATFGAVIFLVCGLCVLTTSAQTPPVPDPTWRTDNAHVQTFTSKYCTGTPDDTVTEASESHPISDGESYRVLSGFVRDIRGEFDDVSTKCLGDHSVDWIDAHYCGPGKTSDDYESGKLDVWTGTSCDCTGTPHASHTSPATANTNVRCLKQISGGHSIYVDANGVAHCIHEDDGCVNTVTASIATPLGQLVPGHCVSTITCNDVAVYNP